MVKLRAVSIRTVLLALLVGEMVLAVGLTWRLWYRNGQDAVEQIEDHLTRELTTRIEERIVSFVAIPPIVNDLNLSQVSLGRIDVGDIGSPELEAYVWQQLKAFPSISYIDIGTEEGKFLGVERMADGSINLEVVTDGTMHTYKLDAERRRISEKKREGFVVQKRPWYTAAVQANAPTWTNVYPFFSVPPRLGITAVRPVRGKDGKLEGVLGCDLVLSAMDAFLRSLRVGETGRAFLLERSGDLLASSSPLPSVHMVDGKPERVHAASHGDDLIRETARQLQERFGSLGKIDEKQLVRLTVDGQSVLVRTAAVQPQPGIDWLTVVAVPEADFTGDIEKNTRTTLWLFLALLAVATPVVLITAGMISRSIRDASQRLDDVARFNLENASASPSVLEEVRTMQSSMGAMTKALRSFEKYVPADVVRKLVLARREAKLGVEPAETTLLFSDIAGFTTIAETLEPEKLVVLMGEYLSEMSAIILESDGTLDKYIGDAIMAFWNAPSPVANHPSVACGVALESQARLGELRTEWTARGLPGLHARIGLHTGNVLVGNLGSESRLNYTAIGDNVNLAARLESLNATYGTEIMISDALYQLVKDEYVARPLDVVAVKGKSEGIVVYELLGRVADVSPDVKDRVKLYATALQSYRQRDFARAEAQLAQFLELHGADRAAEILLARAAAYRVNPPPADWNGTHQMDHK